MNITEKFDVVVPYDRWRKPLWYPSLKDHNPQELIDLIRHNSYIISTEHSELTFSKPIVGTQYTIPLDVADYEKIKALYTLEKITLKTKHHPVALEVTLEKYTADSSSMQGVTGSLTLHGDSTETVRDIIRDLSILYSLSPAENGRSNRQVMAELNNL